MSQILSCDRPGRIEPPTGNAVASPESQNREGEVEDGFNLKRACSKRLSKLRNRREASHPATTTATTKTNTNDPIQDEANNSHASQKLKISDDMNRHDETTDPLDDNMIHNETSDLLSRTTTVLRNVEEVSDLNITSIRPRKSSSGISETREQRCASLPLLAKPGDNREHRCIFGSAMISNDTRQIKKNRRVTFHLPNGPKREDTQERESISEYEGTDRGLRESTQATTYFAANIEVEMTSEQQTEELKNRIYYLKHTIEKDSYYQRRVEGWDGAVCFPKEREQIQKGMRPPDPDVWRKIASTPGSALKGTGKYIYKTRTAADEYQTTKCYCIYRILADLPYPNTIHPTHRDHATLEPSEDLSFVEEVPSVEEYSSATDLSASKSPHILCSLDGASDPRPMLSGNAKGKAAIRDQQGPHGYHGPPQNRFSSDPRDRRLAHVFKRTPDRPAAAAWRRQEQPDREIAVPRGARLQLTFTEYTAVADSFGAISGAYIAVTMKEGRMVFQIFGHREQIELTTQLYRKWYDDMTQQRTSGRGTWASIEAFNENKWMQMETELQRAADKAVFKKLPPQGMQFHFTYIVFWSIVCVARGILPRDVLGNHLEIFDPIRMESEVYIVLSTNAADGCPVFRIMGEDGAKVVAAKQHVENLMAQIEARFFEVDALHICLVETGDQVWLSKYANAARELPGVVPTLRMELERRATILDQSMLATLVDDQQLVLMEHQIIQCLDAIRRQKRIFNMSIHLGMFVLTKYLQETKSTYTHKEFMNMMDNAEGNVEAYVTQSVGSRDIGDKMLDRLTAANDFLAPVGQTTGYLEEVVPVFRGKFVLENIAEPGRSFLLQVEFTSNEEGDIVRLPPKWSRFEAGEALPMQHMNVNLIDLLDGRAWHFALESTTSVARPGLPIQMRSFADLVKINKGLANDFENNKVFLKWSTFNSINIQDIRLERVFVYQVRNTGFLVEASHVMERERRGSYWTLAVKHGEWPMHLAQLETLVPGRAAKWGEVMPLFFPDDGFTCYTTLVDLAGEDNPAPSAGLRLLVNKLICLSTIVAGRVVAIDS